MSKILLLDFDGTLLHTKNAIIACMMQTLQHFSYFEIEILNIEYVINQGLTLEESFTILTSKIKNDKCPSLSELVTFYRTIYNGELGLQKTVLYPNIEETLSELYKKSIILIVVSNKGQVAIEKALSFFNIAQYISLVAGSIPGMKPKPDPMVFNDIIRKALPDTATDEFIVVGDTLQDLLFAKNINTKSCWAKYGYGNTDDCLKAQPDFVIDSFYDLLSLLILDKSCTEVHRP